MSALRTVLEKPWSETTMMSVSSKTPFSFSTLTTSPRFLSLSAMAASDSGAPTPFACWVMSGSLSQSSEYFGMPFFHRPWTSALVVHPSEAAFGEV